MDFGTTPRMNFQTARSHKVDHGLGVRQGNPMAQASIASSAAGSEAHLARDSLQRKNRQLHELHNRNMQNAISNINNAKWQLYSSSHEQSLKQTIEKYSANRLKTSQVTMARDSKREDPLNQEDLFPQESLERCLKMEHSGPSLPVGNPNSARVNLLNTFNNNKIKNYHLGKPNNRLKDMLSSQNSARDQVSSQPPILSECFKAAENLGVKVSVERSRGLQECREPVRKPDEVSVSQQAQTLQTSKDSLHAFSFDAAEQQAKAGQKHKHQMRSMVLNEFASEEA